MTLKIDYTPNAKQAMFHSCDADEVVYGGAKGGGKSCALVMEALAYCMENAGASAYLFRETYDDLESNLVAEWKKKVPKELYTYSETKHIATLINSSTVTFRYISSDADADGYQGRSIDFIGVDELTKHSERAIQIILSCLRSPKGFAPKFCGTCNPGGKGHTWVKKRYIDATKKGAEIVTDPKAGTRIAFIPASVYDNDVIMENDPAYVRRLENLPEMERKAFLDGDWDIFQGQYFTEWNYDIHTCAPFLIPADWRRYRAIDYGLDMYACYWVAVDNERNAYVYRELCAPDLPISVAAEKTLAATPGGENIYATLAPPDLWNRTQESGKSKEIIFAENGLQLTKASNDREAGWLAIKELLRVNEGGKARIRIFNSCVKLIEHLPQLQRDDKRPTDAATEPHDITHSPDALRYFALYWVRPAPQEKKDGSTETEQMINRLFNRSTKKGGFWH